MAETLRSIPIQYEPLRENRFTLEFPTELGIESWKIQSVKLPELSLNVVEIPFFNVMDYLIGRGTWSQIEMTLIDTIGPSTTTQLMEWVRLHHESLTGRQGYAAGYKKDLILKGSDPTGVDTQKWTLRDCQIVTVGFGNYDMGSDAVKMINLTIQPRDCVHSY
jgi:hypothetical protein